jgi:hypothetical protein
MSAARRFAACAVVLLAAFTRPLFGQDSEFGIQGLGTPGRPESVHARSTGGAFAAFDPTSLLTEASLAEIGSLTASTGEGTSYRDLESPASSTWLRSTRFPLFSLGGPLGHGHRVFLGGGFSSYLDRAYSVVTRDSMTLRGVTQPYTDQISSDGGIGDVRIGAALRVNAHLALGLGVHFLPGSTRETAVRRFDDTTSYATVTQSAQVRYDGLGYSGSALLTVSPRLALIAFARNDTHLNQYLGDTLTAKSDLPRTFGGAVRWAPLASARFAGSVIWRTWSGATANAFNTLNWSAGAELGHGGNLRLGVRGGQLPFGPGATAPSEWGVSVGTGHAFAKGRGFLDVGLERLARDGDGLHERVWSLLLGMTIRP